MINSRDLNDLRPDVKANVETLLAECKKQGLKVLVTQTKRDNEYQALLYAKGRTAPGGIVTNSKTTTFHGAGLAIDFCQNIKGREYSDASFFQNVATIAKQMGFTWGGDWKSIVDKPHLQWDNHGKSTYKNAPTMPLFVFNKKEEDDMTYYQTFKDIPKAYQPTIQKVISEGALKGKANGNLDVSEDFCRILTILDRLGVLENEKRL